MRKRYEVFILLSLFLLSSLHVECHPGHAYASTKRASKLLKHADRCRRLLYRSYKRRKYRSNWISCIYKYRKIYRLYPATPQAPWAIYHAANLYLNLYSYSRRKKDLENALTLFRWLAERYPKHRLADDAQYKIGWIYYKYKHRPQKAYVEFLKVEIRFPSGDMLRRAKRMLDRLAVLISRKDTQRLKQIIKKRKVALKDIRHWATSTYTRVVIDLEGRVRYSHRFNRSHGSAALVIYIKDAFVPYNNVIKRKISKGIVKDVKATQYKDSMIKVALNFKNGTFNSYKIFHLYDPFRIVVDIGEKEKAKSLPGSRIATKKIKKRKARRGIKKTKRPDNAISLARQLGLGVRRIVIDPGHGGRDPGCRWGNIKEKDIALKISKMLAKRLKRRLGCEVYLTRTKDIYLPLERRTAIANLRKADIFISIHVNAHRNRGVRGIETYFLNMAIDERAILVAARENATSEKNISDLQSIISDLMLNTKIRESSQLAYDIQKRMVSVLSRRYRHIENLGVKQGPFYVLVGARMPAVLVEVGFITNRLERRRLTNSRYEKLIAEGICQGIGEYVREMEQIASIAVK